MRFFLWNKLFFEFGSEDAQGAAARPVRRREVRAGRGLAYVRLAGSLRVVAVLCAAAAPAVVPFILDYMKCDCLH